MARSPGMKYKHYAPRAEVTILHGSFNAYRKYLASMRRTACGGSALTARPPGCRSPVSNTVPRTTPPPRPTGCFPPLRELDRNGAAVVYARCPEKDGVSMAVYNRLIRAAAFRVVEL